MSFLTTLGGITVASLFMKETIKVVKIADDRKELTKPTITKGRLSHILQTGRYFSIISVKWLF